MPFKFINLWQTNEERKQRYHLARSLGVNSNWAGVMRDWRTSKIERLFNLTGLATSFKANPHAPYAQFRLPSFPFPEIVTPSGIPHHAQDPNSPPASKPYPQQGDATINFKTA